MRLLPLNGIPSTCSQSGSQSKRVSESELRSHGVLLLGSKEYDENMETVLKKGSSRFKQGDEFVCCCHVVNQYPHAVSNQFVNTRNQSLRGVYIHAPGETDAIKSVSFLQTAVQTFVAPALGSGPIQPLQLGEVYALINVAGTKDPQAASRPEGISEIPGNPSGPLPVYENAPGYENPPAYQG
ncbi:MAG: hypothetical protein EOO38_01090 [Cytophagaceae bacterium]|nr:MAG: hypothetical protein EOO38_01090 [Cytophagaceae bacterium]